MHLYRRKGSIREEFGRTRTTLVAVIFISKVFLQVRKIDNFTAREFARGTGEGERVVVGSDTWRTVKISCYMRSSAAGNTSSDKVAATIVSSCWSGRIIVRVAVEGGGDTAAGGAGGVHGGVG